MMNHTNQKGFTLLLAVLVSGIVLSIGLAIFNITFKEIRLSSSGRESQFAFYAADSGIECALFHDQQNDAFATTSPAGSISCNNTSLTVTSANPSPNVYTRTFQLILNTEDNRYCADVVVTKEDLSPLETTIVSRGTNTCNIPDNRRVERAIEVTY